MSRHRPFQLSNDADDGRKVRQPIEEILNTSQFTQETL